MSCYDITVSYPLLSHDNYAIQPLIHLDDVDCTGNESMLSECSHRGISIHNCVAGAEDAGVICTSRLSIELQF